MSDAIADIYRQVDAPNWAAPNLDGLVDVLRDLSWLPAGPVLVRVPARTEQNLARLLAVLIDAEARTAGSAHPVLVLVG